MRTIMKTIHDIMISFTIDNMGGETSLPKILGGVNQFGRFCGEGRVEMED